MDEGVPPLSEQSTHVVWYPGHDLLLKDIRRAENCHLFDSAGGKYVDLESGVWCTPVGHGHPRVLHAISEQLALIAHTGFGYTTGIVEDAAQKILSVLGLKGGKCVFLCSGSESVEFGVRVAQSVIDRPVLLTMFDSYFGAYGSASQRHVDEWFCFDWTVCRKCPHPNECDDRCTFWARIPHDRIGGFLFEPGSSSGLVRFPPEKLIRNIVDTVKKNNGLVLVNEVTTGIGRTGRWFGCRVGGRRRGYRSRASAPRPFRAGSQSRQPYPVSSLPSSNRA